MRIRRGVVAGVLLGAFVALAGAQQGGRRNPVWDWPTDNRDLGGTRYSPLTQINTTNVSTLTQAWLYRLRPEPGRPVPAIDSGNESLHVFALP